MPLWFVYAVLAALFGGLHAFTHKIAAERAYNSGYFQGISTACAACIGALYITYTQSWQNIFIFYGCMWTFLSAVFFVLNTSTKIESLKYIESTLFFPLNKTVTVCIVTVLGVVLLREHLTHVQMIGIALSLTVPFLLITKHIHAHQKNMGRGIIYLSIAGLFSACATLVNKLGALSYATPVMFVFVTHVCISSLGFFDGVRSAQKTSGSIRTLMRDTQFIAFCLIAGAFQFLGFLMNVSSLAIGNLSLAYAIMSLQIIVPIFLSVLWYNEHLDMRKFSALTVSIVASYLMK